MSSSEWLANVEPGRRPLNANEVRIIERIAEHVSEDKQRQILFDLARSSVRSTTDDGDVIEFDIEGYERPPYTGQHDLDVDARVLDSDGALIGIVLYTDQHGRLFELEYVRWDFEEILDPQWDTLTATACVARSGRDVPS